jgi:hypothetical protein
MKAIVIAFTLKGQDFENILPQLRKVSEENPSCILIHGFLPRRVLEEKHIPTDVVNALENLFPVQLNMFNEKPLREEMVDVAKKLEATVYVIGEVKEGVAEEVELYKAAGLPVHVLELNVEK